MTTIYLVRHGESQANVERVFSNGRVDLPLTERGRRQAERAAAWLADRGIARVFTSPLLRARQTAAIIAGHVGAEVTVLADLDEVRVGDLDGRRDAASWTQHDRILARWRRGDHTASFPGGETYGQAYVRFGAVLRDIACRHPDETVAAVSHGAIAGTVLPRLCPDLGALIEGGTLHWAMRNAAVSVLHVEVSALTCASWGAVDHIPPDM